MRKGFPKQRKLLQRFKLAVQYCRLREEIVRMKTIAWLVAVGVAVIWNTVLGPASFAQDAPFASPKVRAEIAENIRELERIFERRRAAVEELIIEIKKCPSRPDSGFLGARSRHSAGSQFNNGGRRCFPFFRIPSTKLVHCRGCTAFSVS